MMVFCFRKLLMMMVTTMFLLITLAEIQGSNWDLLISQRKQNLLCFGQIHWFCEIWNTTASIRAPYKRQTKLSPKCAVARPVTVNNSYQLGFGSPDLLHIHSIVITKKMMKIIQHLSSNTFNRTRLTFVLLDLIGSSGSFMRKLLNFSCRGCDG